MRKAHVAAGLVLLGAALICCGCGGPANRAPTADGQVATTTAATAVPITLTGTDPDGDALTFVMDAGPQNGQLDSTGLPAVVYTPDSGFTGVDSFTFRVSDGALDSGAATVYIGVDNTAPTTSGLTDSTPEDTPLALVLPGSDANSDALMWVVDGPPPNGTVDMSAAPSVTYTPALDYYGSDSFTFLVTDGVDSSAAATVDITVTPVNDAPVADDGSVSTIVGWSVSITLTASDAENDALSWAIDTQPQHGTLTGTAPDLTYTPDAGYEGDDDLTFHVNDGEFDSAVATITITVNQPRGRAWTWGGNIAGQLGDGTTTDRHTPAVITALGEVTAVGAGAGHSLALSSNGTAWAWGMNFNGQLGDGTSGNNRFTPVQVLGLTGATRLAAGSYHSLALKADRTAWAWGENVWGQLGDGTTTSRSTPVQVPGLTDVVAIAAGNVYSLALKADGTVRAWGRNASGELGDDTTTDRQAPVQVQGLSGVSSIAARGDHSLALKTDGTVWGWGNNSNGQCGDGTFWNDRLIPVQVLGGATGDVNLQDVVAIAAGWGHSLALKADGTVWAWGGNGSGALGDGTTATRTTPVQMAGLTGVRAIGAGSGSSFAVKADGTVWACGRNIFGELGDGTTDERHAPVQVLGLQGGTVVVGCSAHSIAIAD